MSVSTVLIAGFSGRALAASARRAGFLPLVADAFADNDTRALAAACEHLPAALREGFRYETLAPALDRLAAQAETPPVGLVLGAGFEDTPGLVGKLAAHHTILGCSAEAIAAAKDPSVFFRLLADLGIAHPETRAGPPADARGWLTKRIGGAGGTHVARCRQTARALRGRYVQREIEGMPLSLTAIVGKGAAFAFARPWCAPMPRRPFRYGGLAGSIDIDADLEARLIEIGVDVARGLGLVGLVSFDLMIADGSPYLIEVNPRPGASLDVFDDAAGTLFETHLAAARGEDPTPLLQRNWRPAPRAVACLYADVQALTVPAIDWPDWTTDRPAAGALIERHAPVATVHAKAENADAAEALVMRRLGELEALLYGRPQK